MPKKICTVIFLLLFLAFNVSSQTQPGSGNSLFFNGSNNYINLGTNYRNITNKVTVEAWIKTSTTKYQWIVGKYNNSEDKGFHLFTQNGKAAMAGREGVGTYRSSGYSNTLISDGKWHHVVGVVNLNKWEIWVDGNLESSISSGTNNPNLNSSAPLTIGNYQVQSENYFYGEIDEVRIWNIARNAQEIRDYMCRKVSASSPGLVGYYKLDEGTGTTSADQSSFNFTGTFVNMSSSAWRISGAPIGDISSHLYISNWTNKNVKLAGILNDTLIAKDISSNASCVHIYRVNGTPNALPPNYTGAYFGIFAPVNNPNPTTNSTYTVGYKAASITCSTDSAILARRTENDVTNWNQSYVMSLNPVKTYFEKTNEFYRGEYHVRILDAKAKVQILGNLTSCNGAYLSLLASTTPPHVRYLWSTGQKTEIIQVTASGKYYLTATDSLGCVTSDTVQVTIAPPLVVNAENDVAFCTGESGTIGAAPTAGYTYSWSPAAGLSSTNVANPTVSFPNTTNSPISQTYTLTATLNGCSATDQVTVTVNPKPLAPTGLNLQICSGEPAKNTLTPLTGHTYSWSPATGLSNPNIVNPTITLINPSSTSALLQTYTLTITNNYGCITTVPVQINVKPAVIANAGPDFILCDNLNQYLGTASISGYTYSWSPATGLSNPTLASPKLTLKNFSNVPIQQTYTVTSTFNGCSATDQVTVTILPYRGAGDDKTVCPDEPVVLGTPAVTGLTYSWSPATGLSNPSIAQPTLTLGNNTSSVLHKWYNLSVTNSAGCYHIYPIQVHVKPLPIANAGADITICSGDTASLSATAASGYSYIWTSVPGLSDTTISNPTYTLINNTNFPISKTISLTTTANGCTSTDQVTITVNPLPVSDAGADKTTCPNQPVGIGATPVAGNTYSWSPATGLSNAAVSNPTATLTNTSTGPITQTYILTVTNTYGCIKTDTVNINVNPKPIAPTGLNRQICSGEPIIIGPASVANWTYSWTPTIGLSNPNISNPTVTLTNPSTTSALLQTYTLTITNNYGCITTVPVLVNVIPAVIANAGADVAICYNTSATLGTGATSGYTYSWSPATGLSNPNIANPTIALPNSTGVPIQQTYTVTTTLSGCSVTDQVVVTVNPEPVFSPFNIKNICPNEPLVIGGAAIAGYTYSWSPGTGLSSTTVSNPTVILPNTSSSVNVTQQYTLTVTNNFGCITTLNFPVTVFPQPIVDAGTDKTICSGGTTTIGSNAETAHTYTWSPATGLSDPNIANPTVTLVNNTSSPITQTYTLSATRNGCIATDQVTVTVNPLPTAVAGADKTICSGQTIGIGATPVAGNTYSWSPASGLSNAAIANPTVTLTNNSTAPITQTYILTETNAFGCIDTDAVNVHVNPLPISNAGNDVTICSGSSATLGTSATTGYTYAWSPATGLSSTTSSNPTVSLTNNTSTPITQVYTVTSTYYGCTTSDQVTVTVQPKVIVNAGPDKTICGDKSVSIGTAALPNYTYSWAAANGLSSTTSATPVYTGTNNTSSPIPVKLYLTATSTLSNCSVTDTVTVTINPKPVVDSIIGSFSVCPGVLGVDYHIKNPRLTAYQWIVEGGTIASGQGTTAITVNWGVSGPGKVKTYTLNTFGCSSDTILFPVVINPLLITQKPAGPRQLCFYEAKNIYYQPPVATNGSYYTYKVVGGTITSQNPSTTGVYVNWHAPGIGKIVVTETSTTNLAHCFGVSDTVYVTINPSPDTTLSIIGKASACAYSQNHVYSLAGATGSTYLWKLNGATLPGNGNTINVNLQAAGIYTLTVLETNSFGCPSRTIAKTITATPLPGTLYIIGPTIICPDNQQNLQYSVSGLPGSTYNWKVTGGTITSGNGSNTIFVDFDNTRDKTLEVVETSSGNCVGTRFDLAAKFDASELKLETVSTAEANHRNIEISLNMLNATVNTQKIDIYRRENGAGNAFLKIASIPNSQPTYTDMGLETGEKIYEYRLESMNECGTQVRRSVHHNVLRLTAVAEESSKTAFLSWNTYKGWGKNGVSKYEIYGKADNGSFAMIQEIQGPDSVATLTRIADKGFNQCYRIKAISNSGLVSWSNETCVTFENKVVIYNIITANDDRKNDFFTVENIHLYPGNEVTLYNRWGVEVFRKKDYMNDWDGKNCTEGTYYYLLKLKDGRSFKGWFDIVR